MVCSVPRNKNAPEDYKSKSTFLEHNVQKANIILQLNLIYITNNALELSFL